MVKLLYGKGGGRSEAYIRYVICKEMGWDYYTFQAQPAYFIEEIMIIMNQEAQKENKDASEARRKSKIRTPSFSRHSARRH